MKGAHPAVRNRRVSCWEPRGSWRLCQRSCDVRRVLVCMCQSGCTVCCQSTGPGTTPSRCHRNNISIYIREEGKQFPLWRADRATFLYTMRKTNEASRDYLRSLCRGMWARCQKLSVPLLVRVCEVMRHVCVNLSLTDAIFIILVYESRNHHITTDHRAKINRFFGHDCQSIFLEKPLPLPVYCHQLLKASLQLTCWEEYLCFPSEYPFICSLFHASISQITCICSIIYLFN